MENWVQVAGPLVALSLIAGSVVLYVWCLVSAAKNSKWVWFVLMLLVAPLSLAYALFARKQPAGARGPYGG
jgi:hypothetical protein